MVGLGKEEAGSGKPGRKCRATAGSGIRLSDFFDFVGRRWEPDIASQRIIYLFRFLPCTADMHLHPKYMVNLHCMNPHLCILSNTRVDQGGCSSLHSASCKSAARTCNLKATDRQPSSSPEAFYRQIKQLVYIPVSSPISPNTLPQLIRRIPLAPVEGAILSGQEPPYPQGEDFDLERGGPICANSGRLGSRKFTRLDLGVTPTLLFGPAVLPFWATL